MNLRRQLLLVSLLTLVLPWAGCQFVRETESALREGQQQMLAGTAQAIADALAQFPDQFDLEAAADGAGDELYAHPLTTRPLIDGYMDEWTIAQDSLVRIPGTHGAVSYAAGMHRQYIYLFVDVRDEVVVWSLPATRENAASDAVLVVTSTADGDSTTWRFAAEAPGSLSPRVDEAGGGIETRIAAHWQDVASGYRLEARLPRRLVGSRLGIVVADVDERGLPTDRHATFRGSRPGRFVTPSSFLESVAAGYVQPGLRLTVTDLAGWRLAQVGDVTSSGRRDEGSGGGTGWLRMAYNALLEPGSEDVLAGPDPSGREVQDYVQRALNGEPATSWFRSERSGRAVVAVAQPVWSGNVQTGAVILQQGTDAILSLTNEALARLMNFTLLATVVVAAGLLGWASWLSFRIRRLSGAAVRALDGKRVQTELPSADAGDEIGDLSRSFSHVLRQLGDYNEYLRTLASKLSHEMRTPLTIVTSSLENLEHEPLTDESAKYTARAREGAERLRRILNAMSEAGRVEELIENAEPEAFDLRDVVASAVAAYGDAWPERRFAFASDATDATMHGSPELVIQMLDKLVDNAVGFSRRDDVIEVRLSSTDEHLLLSVTNPGPPLPERMRSQLFDSMVSVRQGGGDRHLGFGLFIARLIATGHGGSIDARNVEGGVTFEVRLPRVGEGSAAG
jgi:two-component system, OmpR family, sensor histidine kinase ChvG